MSIRNIWKDRRRPRGRASRIPRFDSLECRYLLTAGFSIVPSGLPDYVNVPAIASGSDGNLWYAAGSDGIGQITPAGVTTVFPVTNPDGSAASIGGLTLGQDGNIWFTDGNSIGSITPSGAVNLISIPDGNYGFAIASDGAGNLWFTDENGNVEEYQQNGEFSLVALPNASANFLGNQSIAVTPDGNVWVSVYPSTTTTTPDGDTWSVDGVVDKIATDGSVTPITVGTNYDSRLALTVGPDGNVWFIDQASETVGTILADGSITSYAVAGTGQSITAGPDGALWFTLTDTNGNPEIGRVDTSGNVTYFAPSSESVGDLGSLDAITTGPDGAIWFSEDGQTAIGRLDATAAPGTDVPIVDTVPPPPLIVDPTPIPIDVPVFVPVDVVVNPLEVASTPLQGTAAPTAPVQTTESIGAVVPPKPAPLIEQALAQGGTASGPVGPVLPITTTQSSTVVQGPLSYRQARQEALSSLSEARSEARAAYRAQAKKSSVDTTPGRKQIALNQALASIRDSRVEAVGMLKASYRRFRGVPRHHR